MAVAGSKITLDEAVKILQLISGLEPVVAQLITGINWHIMTVVFVLLTLTLQILIPYRHYVFFLKWLSLSLLAYGAVLFSVHVPWGEVLWATFFPDFSWGRDSAAVVVGIFGTTISPYLFFWQASQEVEDMSLRHQSRLLESSSNEVRTELRRIQWDTWSRKKPKAARRPKPHQKLTLSNKRVAALRS